MLSLVSQILVKISFGPFMLKGYVSVIVFPNFGGFHTLSLGIKLIKFQKIPKTKTTNFKM